MVVSKPGGASGSRLDWVQTSCRDGVCGHRLVYTTALHSRGHTSGRLDQQLTL